MKKVLFIFMTFVSAAVAHAHVVENTNPCGGRFFASGISVNKQGLLDYLSGEGPEIMAPGISKLFWLRCFVANFNQTAGKELGETLLDSQGRISGDAVLAVLEASVEVQVSWQEGEINSTYPCIERDTYISFARKNYVGEIVLVYKGYVILSFVCGNPLQDFRKKGAQGREMDFTADRSGTYTVPTTGGAPVIINLKVEGSTISNSGNSGDATAFSAGGGRAPKQPVEDPGVFTPGYNPPAPTYVPANQGQPTYVANTNAQQQPYYTAGSAPVATKPNGVEIAGLVVGGSHLVYDVLMDWIPGSPRRRTNNFFYYGGGSNTPGSVGGPADWPNGLNTGGSYPAGGPSDWFNGQ